MLKYFGAYADTIYRLNTLVPTIPRLGETAGMQKPPTSLHYTTGTADFFIYEYDSNDTMYGKVLSSVHCSAHAELTETVHQQFSLSSLKNNPYLQLDLSLTAGR